MIPMGFIVIGDECVSDIKNGRYRLYSSNGLFFKGHSIEIFLFVIIHFWLILAHLLLGVSIYLFCNLLENN